MSKEDNYRIKPFHLKLNRVGRPIDVFILPPHPIQFTERQGYQRNVGKHALSTGLHYV